MSIQPFTFPDTGRDVRVVTLDGEPWWVAADVADILGYSATSAMTRTLADDEKGVQILHTPGGEQQFTVINEPGLYSAILRSRVERAQRFKRWVTHDVLPSIRKTGSYSVESAFQVPTSFAEALELAARQARAIESAEQRIGELEPAARAWDVLAAADGDYAVADAAKILSRDPAIKLGRDRLFTLLREWGWAYRQGVDGKHHAKQYAIDPGWLSEIPQSHYHPRTGELVLDPPQIRVTVKGLQALHKKLGGVAQLRIDVNNAA